MGVRVPSDMVGLGGDEESMAGFVSSVGAPRRRVLGERGGLTHGRGACAWDESAGAGLGARDHVARRPLRGEDSERAWEGLCAV